MQPLDAKVALLVECIEDYIDANIDLHENNYHDRDVETNLYVKGQELGSVIKDILTCEDCSCMGNSKVNSRLELLHWLLVLNGILFMTNIVVSATSFFHG